MKPDSNQLGFTDRRGVMHSSRASWEKANAYQAYMDKADMTVNLVIGALLLIFTGVGIWVVVAVMSVAG